MPTPVAPPSPEERRILLRTMEVQVLESGESEDCAQALLAEHHYLGGVQAVCEQLHYSVTDQPPPHNAFCGGGLIDCARRCGAGTVVLALEFVAVGDGLGSRSRPPLATRRPSPTTRQDRALVGSGRDTGGLAALSPAPTPSSTTTSAATPPPASAPDATARPERTGCARVL